MSIRTLAGMGIITIASVLITGIGMAQADPPGNTSNDEHNAYLVCAGLNDNPSVSGLEAVLSSMRQDLNDDDVVDGLAYAVLYTCPQYKSIILRWIDTPPPTG